MFLNKNLNANKIKSELNEYGYIIISNIFDENIINKFKEISENKIKELNKKFSLNEKYLKKTIFEQVVNSNEVRNFFDSIDSTNQRYKTEYNCHYLLNHTPKNLNKNHYRLNIKLNHYII